MKKITIPFFVSSLLIGCGGEDNNQSSISPEVENTPPIIEPISDFQLTTNSILTYKVKASDKNKDDVLSYKLDTESSFVTIKQDGTLTLSPSVKDEGIHDISVIVSDGDFNVSSNTIKMDVILPTASCDDGMECMDDGFTNPNLPTIPTNPDLVNYAPTIEPIPNFQLTTDLILTHKVKASDKNKDDVLSYKLDTESSFVTIKQDGTLTFSPSVKDEGVHEISVIVSDGDFNVSSNTIKMDVILPTASCDDGMECMDDGFTNPNLPTVSNQIAELLNEDVSKIDAICNFKEVTCAVNDGIPSFSYKDGNDIVAYPLTNQIKINGIIDSYNTEYLVEYVTAINRAEAGHHDLQVYKPIVDNGTLKFTAEIKLDSESLKEDLFLQHVSFLQVDLSAKVKGFDKTVDIYHVEFLYTTAPDYFTYPILELMTVVR